MWVIIRKAKPETLRDSDTCETKRYLCRKTEENPYRISDSFASRVFFNLVMEMIGTYVGGRSTGSHTIFRIGVEITQGDGGKPEHRSALTAPAISILLYCSLPSYLEITFLP